MLALSVRQRVVRRSLGALDHVLVAPAVSGDAHGAAVIKRRQRSGGSGCHLLPRAALFATLGRASCGALAPRVIVGLAGVPGSGKSTLAAELREEALALLGPGADAGAVVVLGMDGFHLTRAQLAAMPDPEEALRRRGAPWTFDAAGCAARLRDVREAAPDAVVRWPSFDHAVKDPVEDDVVVPAAARLVILEGIYVLHPLDGFDALRPALDEAWFLDTPREEAHARLAARHQAAWGVSAEEAERIIAVNDGLNALVVAKSRALADAVVRSKVRAHA